MWHLFLSGRPERRTSREGHLRKFCITAGLALAAATGSAQAAWKEYPHTDLGFVVEFPDPPKATTGNYRTVLVDRAPVRIFQLKQDYAQFTASIVDLPERKEDGASLMIEAEFNLQLLGDVTGNSISRVEPGKDAVFGHFITINCRSGKVPDQPGQTEAAHAWFKGISGTDCPDGGRLTANIFFHRGRMYLIQGMNLPHEDGSEGPMALRFANSISFFRPDGTRNAADNAP
jgi:hypothetical protein